jgi:serine/threonine-protein kinase
MIGTIIDGRYHIIQNLGQGGFGTTFLAKDTEGIALNYAC